MRRDRFCIPVKVGRQGEAPKGSMVLGSSGSGATVYVEPAPLIPLNNAEAALAAAVEDEEQKILQRLSGLVGFRSWISGRLRCCIGGFGGFEEFGAL